ncbi:MAG: hypothetical protein RLN89_11160 [Parvibaculum sp.]
MAHTSVGGIIGRINGQARKSWISSALKLVGAIACVGLMGVEAGIAAPVEPWRITKEAWSETDERGYSEFVELIGASDCWDVDDCFDNPSNPYRARHGSFRFRADCADFPYLIRAYYAWMNGLPFAYQNGILPQSGRTRDIRYTSGGNRVVSRGNVPATSNGINATSVLVDLQSAISSGSFRVHANANDKRNFTDMYSPRIGRDTIRPGTSIYDANGHVVLVWRVEDDGRVLTISAHPDNSVSRSFYGRNFLRTHPRLGAGFKEWRPIRLVGATRAANGSLVGGHIEALPNEALADFSLMQYIGTETVDTSLRTFDQWRLASFVQDGEAVDYYHYVRNVMASGKLIMNPVNELRSSMRSVCYDVRARKEAVEAAIENRIDKQAAPQRLPHNIYGTFGYWEFYSTPSRDARLKTALKEQRDHIEVLIGLQRQGSPSVEYAGSNLIGDLIAAYDEESQKCVTSYTRSNGARVTMTIDNVVDRIFDVSFDPYQCVERRWGARDADELSSCRDTPDKTAWYNAQRFLRYQIDRTYDVQMSYTPSELEAGPHGPFTGRGVAEKPDLDVRAMLEGMQNSPRAAAETGSAVR